jgi:prepilin-type processing-associated H-X9-DG protein
MMICPSVDWQGKYNKILSSAFPMQYRLTTLFLIIFVVAASLALCGLWSLWIVALWIDAVFLFTAFRLNHAKNLTTGIHEAVTIILGGIIVMLLLIPKRSQTLVVTQSGCVENLKQIGLALHAYHKANNHFPMANTRDKDDNPLFSWRVEILPMLGYGDLYKSLKMDESWDSLHNIQLLNKQESLREYICPTQVHSNNGYFNNYPYSTNYIVIIGPGTAWRKDRPVKLSEFPDGGSHTVMVVEVESDNEHWAEPQDITVDQALRRMWYDEGEIVLQHHSKTFQVLFADGSVWCINKEISKSMWEKILMGEIKDLDSIERKTIEGEPYHIAQRVYPDINPGKWSVIFSVVVWLFSVVLLFRRAIISRQKPVTAL